MELLFEFLFEVYIELMMFVVPEEKATSKKYRVIAVLIALAILFGVLALFIWGFVLLIDYRNKLGIVPIAIAIVISIIQIVVGFILHDKKSDE